MESEADLICLQEVNRYGECICNNATALLRLTPSPWHMLSMYADDFFKPQLAQAGYTGLFWPKACSPAEQYGFPCDGCALFYRTERFSLMGSPCGAGSDFSAACTACEIAMGD